MPALDYRYELRRGEEVVATGHLTRDRPFEVGERIGDRRLGGDGAGGRAGVGRARAAPGGAAVA
jgi:hypothetical protein